MLRRGLCGTCERDRAKDGWRSRYVDAQPVRDHVNMLRDAGMSIRRISALAGLNRKDVQILLNGRSDRNTPPSARVWDITAERLLAVTPPEEPYRVAADRALVHSHGTNRRMQALIAIGYTQDYLCERLGVLPSNGHRLFHAPPPTKRGKRPRVTAATARKVATLYAELENTPGPSDKSRSRAKRLGWLPPIAWDEDTIDKPFPWLDRQAARQLTTSRPLPFTAAYQELRELGYTNAEIARKFGMPPDQLEKRVENRLKKAQERHRNLDPITEIGPPARYRSGSAQPVPRWC